LLRGAEWSEDAKAAALPGQLAILSKQLMQDAHIPPHAAVERQAVVVRDLLDPPIGNDRGDDGAASMLRRAKLAPLPVGAAGSGADGRHTLMSGALCKLTRARECMLEQAASLRASYSPSAAPVVPSTAVSQGTRAQMLSLLRSADPASTSAWEAAGRLHSSLMAELQALSAQMAEAEHRMSTQLAAVVGALLGERAEEATTALAECERARTAAADASDKRAGLWARVQCVARLVELLGLAQEGSAREDAEHRSSSDLLANAVTALTAATASLKANSSGTTVPASVAITAGGSSTLEQALQSAIDAMREREAVTPRDKSVLENSALALESRAAQTHEVLCVLALALHHEHSPGLAPAGAPRSASTMLVRTVLCGEMLPSYLLSFGGSGSDAQLHRLDPHGWVSDSRGRVNGRAPAALCSLLWPPTKTATTAPPPEPPTGDDAFDALLPSAMRAFALCASAQLASHAHAKSRGDAFAEAASTLLYALRVLLKGKPAAIAMPRVPPAPSVLTPAEAEKLVELVAGALVALPTEQAMTPQPSLVGCVLLLLTHHERCRRAGPHSAQLQPLAHRLCVELTTGHADETHAAQLHLLSLVLPLLPDCSNFGAASQLMTAVLHAPSTHCSALLPALLRLVGRPSLALELLEAGLARATPVV